MYIYIISQTLGFIAFIISLFAYHRKHKKDILSNMVASNILNIIQYLLIGAYSGAITKLIAVARDSFIIAKEKRKSLNSFIYLFIFIIIYIISAIFTYNSILSIFPIIAAIIYILFIWNGNEYIIKKAAFFCYFLWLIYNIFVFSLSGIFSNIISIISVFIAIYNNNKNKTK